MEYFLFLLMAGIIRILPHKVVYKLGCAMGSLIYAFSFNRRRIGRTNLDIAFGNSKSAREKNRILKASIVQLAVTALQTVWIGIRTKERVKFLIETEQEGLDLLNSCLKRGKGVFLLVAHYGNWEIMGVNHGYLDTCALHTIVRKTDNPHLEKIMMETRTKSGGSILYRDQPPIKIMRALKQNAGVAVMIDQNISKGGVFVDFFGKKAATTRAIHQLGYKKETPVIPVFCYPTANGKYRIVYGPELAYQKSENKNKDILLMTGQCNAFLESVIRRNPEPWMWAHRRWKTRPKDENEKPVYTPRKTKGKFRKKRKLST